MSEANKAVIRAFVHGVNNEHDLSLVDVFCAPEHTLHHPALPIVVRGRAPLKIALASFFESFPDLHFTIRELVAEGDRVAMRFAVTGTNDGPFGGAPPTGKAMTGTGMVDYRLVDGQIAEAHIQEDIFGMLSQLGLVPGNLTLLQWLNRVGVLRLLKRLGKLPSGPGIDFNTDQDEGMNMSAEANKAVIRRFYEELWNLGDLDVADEVIAPGFVGRAPGAPPSRGPEGVKEFVRTWRDAFPDLKITIDAQYASDDNRVATVFTTVATQEGPLLGIPATGRNATMSGVAISRLVDGKIASDWGEFDMLGLFIQLGIAKPPGAGAPGRPAPAPVA